MSKELREKVATIQADFYCDSVSVEHRETADEIINLILDEVKEAVDNIPLYTETGIWHDGASMQILATETIDKLRGE